mmetsp:Transcript_19879/g.43493  ORF Transcript_19879/g.43493 Transcript_19879/m.43493 type:complete len:210 (+) Transcript_19879:679-1308(+)
MSVSSVCKRGSAMSCRMERPTRCCRRSTLITLTATSWSTDTASWGLATRSHDISDRWTSPSMPVSSPSRMSSTKDPKSAVDRTTPLHTSPTCTVARLDSKVAARSLSTNWRSSSFTLITRTGSVCPTKMASFSAICRPLSSPASRNPEICDAGMNPFSFPTRTTSPPRLATSTTVSKMVPSSMSFSALLHSLPQLTLVFLSSVVCLLFA